MVTVPFNLSRLHPLRTDDDVRVYVDRTVPTRFCVSPEPRDASLPIRRVFVVIDLANCCCCCCLAVSRFSPDELVCDIVAFVFCLVVAPSRKMNGFTLRCVLAFIRFHSRVLLFLDLCFVYLFYVRPLVCDRLWELE